MTTPVQTTVVQEAEIGIVIRTASASVAEKRAPTAVSVTDAKNAGTATLTASAVAEVRLAEVLVERRRTVKRSATASLVRACAARTARAKRQGAGTDVIVRMGPQTRAALLRATPMMKVVFARRPPWEPLHLHRLPRRLLFPTMNRVPLVAGALVVETEETVTKTGTANVSAVGIVAETGSTATVVAPEDIASADVPTPKKLPVMEIPEARGWEMITSALVVERDIPR